MHSNNGALAALKANTREVEMTNAHGDSVTATITHHGIDRFNDWRQREQIVVTIRLPRVWDPIGSGPIAWYDDTVTIRVEIHRNRKGQPEWHVVEPTVLWDRLWDTDSRPVTIRPAWREESLSFPTRAGAIDAAKTLVAALTADASWLHVAAQNPDISSIPAAFDAVANGRSLS